LEWLNKTRFTWLRQSRFYGLSGTLYAGYILTYFVLRVFKGVEPFPHRWSYPPHRVEQKSAQLGLSFLRIHINGRNDQFMVGRLFISEKSTNQRQYYDPDWNYIYKELLK